MKIKVNNYVKGAFKSQLQKLIHISEESKNNAHIYLIPDDLEYRGKNMNRHCWSRKGTRKEIQEIQLLCIII